MWISDQWSHRRETDGYQETFTMSPHYPSLDIYIYSITVIDHIFFMNITICIFQPSRMWQNVNFLSGLNRFGFGVFLFGHLYSFSETRSHTKIKEFSLTYYLPIAEGGIIWSIPFARVLVLCGMQTDESKIWIRVAGFVFDVDINYSSCTSSLKESKLYYKY